MFQNKNLTVLASNLFFKGVDEQIITAIFNSKNFRAEKEGELIFQAGEESNYLYLILQGEVKLKYAGTKGIDSSFRRVKNEFFGEQEVLEKTNRISSAVADTDSIFYLISKEELFKLINQHRHILKNLLFNAEKERDVDGEIPEEALNEQIADMKNEDEQQIIEREIQVDEIVMDEDLADYSFDTTVIEELRDFHDDSYLSYSEDDNEEDDLDFNNNGFDPDENKFEEKSPEEITGELFQNEELNNTLPVQQEFFLENDLSPTEGDLIPAIQDFDHIPEEPNKFEFTEGQGSGAEKELQKNQQLETETLTFASASLKFINNNLHFPLNEIKQLADLLSENSSLPEARQINDVIQSYINSIHSIVNSALEFALQINDQNLTRQNINIILGDILNLLSKYLETRRVHLYKKIETDAGVEVNELKLYAAFFQLGKNACDSMPEGGNIFVSAVKQADTVKIEFIDEGIGIPSSLLFEIFEPMVTHGKPDGAGLGLSITKKIIQDHKGNISIDGELGEGTRILITIPVSEKT
jgi:signal transduction histidine kinase/CRP-like cAMP-binding protein